MFFSLKDFKIDGKNREAVDSTLPLISSTLELILQNVYFRILPNLVLSSPVSILQCNGYYVMVVTSRGGVYVW